MTAYELYIHCHARCRMAHPLQTAQRKSRNIASSGDVRPRGSLVLFRRKVTDKSCRSGLTPKSEQHVCYSRVAKRQLRLDYVALSAPVNVHLRSLKPVGNPHTHGPTIGTAELYSCHHFLRHYTERD